MTPIDPTGETPRPAGNAVGGPTPRDLASPIDPTGENPRPAGNAVGGPPPRDPASPIAIPDEILREIYAHAIAAFPDECCGYLVGRTPGAVDAAVRCRNAQADGGPAVAPELATRGADTGFVIAGDELFRFARGFDGDRPPRIVYHSHTNGAAYFSALDRQIAAGPAYPVQHVVIGVAAHAITEIAQFAWSDAGGEYVEVARWTAESAPR